MSSMAAAAVSDPVPTSRSKAAHVALWVGQVILALAFGMTGAMKLAAPLGGLTAGMPILGDLPGWLVRFIGAVEIAGALGLLLPSLSRIRPRLTSLAAAGLATVMALAVLSHLVRGEGTAIGLPILLGALAAFVAWGRSKWVPITPRSWP